MVGSFVADNMLVVAGLPSKMCLSFPGVNGADAFVLIYDGAKRIWLPFLGGGDGSFFIGRRRHDRAVSHLAWLRRTGRASVLRRIYIVFGFKKILLLF